MPAAFWLRLYLLNKYNYNSLFHNTRFTIDEAIDEVQKIKPVVVSAGYSEIAPTPGSSRNERKAFSSNVLSFSQIEAAEMDKK